MRIKIISKPSDQILEIVHKVIDNAKIQGFVIDEQNPDIIVAIGGDGTLLKAVKLNKPVIAIKAGRRGFLMDVTPDSIDEVFKRLKEKDYRIQEYPLLETNTCGFSSLSFNETGILADQPETILLTLSFLNSEIQIEGDGALISTPQGTTGWSLSATGNILYSINAMEIAFMNPVLSPLKSVVLPPTEIKVKVESKGYPQKIRVTSDGDLLKTIREGSEISIRLSAKKAVIYRFFDIDPLRMILNGKK
ncbi:NAD(+)/NADH kinase [Acidianus sp. HS-5]|uniref:NAD(+)/NADH kinase n=1 Tax=Acidianus sp. HS-5 TaxID=2886040 RepID=UPI001F1ADC19|nr:NAD(+)/NADH kinase [Acidianus sp. HS-5]BDC18334.1 NAD(+) kinase [Acidianus sp. HS-5]